MSNVADPKPPHCVIADDLRASRELLRSWVAECGYECTTTSNGEDAWAAVKALQPQLIVTDIEMPVASGLDLLCSLRHHRSEQINSIPVIVISSLQDDDIRSFVQSAGGTVFLTKPLEKTRTQQIVQRLDQEASVVNHDFQYTVHEQPWPNKRISPTLRRLYREVQENGPKFS
ncbi:response regulator [Novipirellula caenicola]|uniref:Regulator of RpoS n=1 Tax=Novipirellula caenicola TaxID=1536901 RepID=A0ABP9VL15_9BACT